MQGFNKGFNLVHPLRITYPGAFYHVTSRGNERKAVFKSKRDREKFLEYLESATQRYDARLHTYCMMEIPIITCCLRLLRAICLKLCGILTERTRPILMLNEIDPDICFKDVIRRSWLTLMNMQRAFALHTS